MVGLQGCKPHTVFTHPEIDDGLMRDAIFRVSKHPQGFEQPERLLLDSLSDQLVLDGIAGGGGSRGDLDFAVDGGEVVVDGAGTDEELVGDLRVGESLGEEAQDFDFAGGQAGRRGGCWFREWSR